MLTLVDFFFPHCMAGSPEELLRVMMQRAIEAERAGFFAFMARTHCLDQEALARVRWQEWYLIEMYFKWKEKGKQDGTL